MKFKKIYSISELTSILNAKAIGNNNNIATGINEIHRVENGDITFVDNKKYYEKALKSKATIIIINEEVACPTEKTLIICSDPFAAYIKIVKLNRKFVPSKNPISENSNIGENTIIQPFVFIGENVTIGKNCIIHSNVTIYDNSIIGDNTIIHSGTIIGADAYYFQKTKQGYRKMESCGRTIIGNNVEIGALCSIDKGVSSDTTIGNGCKFDNHVQVGHDTIIGNNCLIGAHCAIAGVANIEDDVILWAKVAINKDIVIGKGAIILATSAVDKNLIGNKTYFGAPAEEAIKKWRELAAIRNLPEFIKNIK